MHIVFLEQYYHQKYTIATAMRFILCVLIIVPYLNGRERKYPLHPNDWGMSTVTNSIYLNYIELIQIIPDSND